MLLVSLLLMASPLQAAFDATHAAWNALLQAHVHWHADGTSSDVDYAGMAGESDALDAYLAQLAVVDAASFASWPQPEREAFLINAYNAATVQLILTRYPQLESIKDLGGWFSSPWKQKFVALLGANRSLDDIEHGLLRGASDYNDPRIHFAVNCASIGCPALRPEAFVGEQLDAQLEDQTVRFLRDQERNRYAAGRDRLEVSRIFDWYGDDFERHAGGVANFLSRYSNALQLDVARSQRLQAGDISIAFAEYDWRLNRVRP